MTFGCFRSFSFTVSAVFVAFRFSVSAVFIAFRQLKVIRDCIGVAVLCPVIGPKNLAPPTLSITAFSRAYGSLLVFTSRCFLFLIGWRHD